MTLKYDGYKVVTNNTYRYSDGVLDAVVFKKYTFFISMRKPDKFFTQYPDVGYYLSFDEVLDVIHRDR